MGVNFLASLVLSLALLASSPSRLDTPSEHHLWIETASGQHVFEVEIARTHSEQQRGMMYRRSMEDHEGMFFPFQKDRLASFWMKNTYIPLDIIFIDSAGRIVNIAENAEPLSQESQTSHGKVRAVLEIKGGLSRKLGIGPGATVHHLVFDNMDACPEEAEGLGACK